MQHARWCWRCGRRSWGMPGVMPCTLWPTMRVCREVVAAPLCVGVGGVMLRYAGCVGGLRTATHLQGLEGQASAASAGQLTPSTHPPTSSAPHPPSIDRRRH